MYENTQEEVLVAFVADEAVRFSNALKPQNLAQSEIKTPFPDHSFNISILNNRLLSDYRHYINNLVIGEEVMKQEFHKNSDADYTKDGFILNFNAIAATCSMVNFVNEEIFFMGYGCDLKGNNFILNSPRCIITDI